MTNSHVAILIPSSGQRALANLARDAIAKFTTDVSHEVWLLDHPASAPWPENGSEANGLALDMMIDHHVVHIGGRGLYGHAPTHFFAMHDDALPLRTGWLSYLLQQGGDVVGVKASERNGCAHASGVLFTREFALSHSMLHDLPRRDAGEWPGWCAPSHCHRGEPCAAKCSEWWRSFSCDVSYRDDSAPFYVHLGGGTLNRRPDIDRWIAAARRALSL